MKKHLLLAVLLAVLLSGCAPAERTGGTEPTSSAAPLRFCLYESNEESSSALQGYLLSGLDADDVMSTKKGFLLFSYKETSTQLTLIDFSSMNVSVLQELDGSLTPEYLRQYSGGFSCFLPDTGETLVLDTNLKEISRIQAPKGLSGRALLSRDRATLFYCTADAIRALDLNTGISRILKQITYPHQTVTNLWEEANLLQCTLTDENGNTDTLFLSTDTGESRTVFHGALKLLPHQTRYYVRTESELLFGTLDSDPLMLTADEAVGNCHFLPEANAIVSADGSALRCYDLNRGQCTSSESVSFEPVRICAAPDGRVCILVGDNNSDCTILYLWDTARSPSGDECLCIGPHYTREAPDQDGLAQCAIYAQELSQRHGIQILTGWDAVQVQPGDCTLDWEYRADVLMRRLTQLDSRLSHYPEGFLAAIGSYAQSLTICLVDGIAENTAMSNPDTSGALLFWDGYDAYIALTESGTEGSLYHQLCHLIDTVVLTESNAYDQWNTLNPTGFRYDNDYTSNRTRNSTEYLRQEARYFIDMYSMSFAKEDRARIMEYAMTPGNSSYFESPFMQAKLRRLCQGIRDAFGLEKSPDIYLWEQYLEEPLT